jgi:hypothetical protein
MDAALALALWVQLVKPPVFAPADLTRVAESHERERARIRAAIALSTPVSGPEAERRALEASERGGSISGLQIVNGRIVR